MERITELPGGGFKWGRYTTGPEVTTRAEAWGQLNPLWRQDRQIRIGLLRELESRPAKSAQRQPGEAYTLKHHDFQKTYVGRLWTDGRQVRFQEDGTGILATAEMPQSARPRECFQQRDLLLLKSMAAEHAKARSSARQRARAARQRAIVPVTAGDLAVRSTVKDGKLLYSWSDGQ